MASSFRVRWRTPVRCDRGYSGVEGRYRHSPWEEVRCDGKGFPTAVVPNQPVHSSSPTHKDVTPPFTVTPRRFDPIEVVHCRTILDSVVAAVLFYVCTQFTQTGGSRLMSHNRPLHLLVLIALVLSFVLAACGATPTATPQPTATAAPTATKPAPTAVPPAPTATAVPRRRLLRRQRQPLPSPRQRLSRLPRLLLR